MGMYIIISIVTFVIGGLLVWLIMRYLLKSRHEAILREAEKEAEVIKKNKRLGKAGFATECQNPIGGGKAEAT